MSLPMPSGYRVMIPAVCILTVAIAALIFWKPWKKPVEKPAVDMAEIAKLNNRGIGLMDQLSATKYAAAAAVFQEIVDKAPDWQPGKINLAIALLNTAEPANLDRAVAIFNEILSKSDDPHAHYCLGIILVYRNEIAAAAPHFEAVTKIDPGDAHAWYNLGMAHPQGRESVAAKDCFQKALALNPYLNAARYALAMHPHERDDKTALALLAEKQALEEANWEAEYRIVYTEMGKYADVIGRTDDFLRRDAGPLPLFSVPTTSRGPIVSLPAGVRWATLADVNGAPNGPALLAGRGRVGGAMTLLDFDRDGKPDVFLPMAVVEGGQVRNVLLRGDGDGKFRDVTAESGLAAGPPCSAACVGDFDNDGFPDLCLAGPGRVSLYRNDGGKKFADVTAAAGLDKLAGYCRSCLWFDIDQDGDLDLALAFASDGKITENGLVVMLNAGEAPPAGPGAKGTLPLSVKFKRCNTLPKEVTGTPVTHVMIADLDGDKDVDMVVTKSGRPMPVYNDRLLRFHTGNRFPDLQRAWIAGVTLDAQADDRSDALMMAEDGSTALMTAKDSPAGTNMEEPVELQVLSTSPIGPVFCADEVIAPPLLQASAFDIDLDGATDIIGLTAPQPGKPAVPTVLHNEGGKLVHRADAFGPADTFPPDIVAVAVADIDGDCQPDLLYWSEGQGLGWRRNLGNGNRAVRVDLSGRRDKASNLRTNADGIGCRVWALAGPVTATIENVTLSSGPGQSLLPLTLGIGKADVAEAIRVRWPDGVPQAETDKTACEDHRITELNRKETSCPVLLTWDGTKFAYVTDCLGGGAIGETTADGSIRAPRPEESIRIDGRLLKPKNGQYVLKLAEPMDEVMYLDRAQLTAIDHPPGWHVVPDERFATADPPPTQELLTFREWNMPKAARDHRGTDMTAALKDRDGKTVNAFARRSWLGFAEDHFVELDFGAVAAKPGQRWFLVLHGWTDYPYPESIFAADQAGVKMRPPLLERTNAKGEWEPVGEIGFPAGLPKTMTAEVTGKLPPAGGKYRIRTNLQIYWDQIALAPLEATPDVTIHHAKLSAANLVHRGFMREIPPATPTDPVAYDDSKTEPVAATKWKGKLTRTGAVTELLDTTDDRHVICGPGDEVTIHFAGLPPVPEGRERTFVLRTWGYCKDTAPFTNSGGSVHPLPFRAMPMYPYGADVKVPAAQVEYDKKWNTRAMTGGR